jgi:hypothetical protein
MSLFGPLATVTLVAPTLLSTLIKLLLTEEELVASVVLRVVSLVWRAVYASEDALECL